MLTEKDPQVASSETSTQSDSKIDEGGHARYPIELKDSLDTSDPEAALTFDPNSEEIKKLRWKVDKRFIPLLAVMYLCSYLDRANIGNAKVAGMETDLNLKPGEFNTAMSIFYVGYILGEVPSNMALKRFGPRLWIPAVMFVWGTIMIAMASVKTAVAGAFGGLLAYGISHMDGVCGLEGWQWIFILEGIPTIVVCVIAYIYLPDFPATSAFLTPAERALAIKRLAVDVGPSDESRFSWVQFRAAFKDWKVHMYFLITILHHVPFASLGLFIPSIVQG
ncbi:hypothetical protein BGZ96_007364, partial [Linnemannia gamsii]